MSTKKKNFWMWVRSILFRFSSPKVLLNTSEDKVLKTKYIMSTDSQETHGELLISRDQIRQRQITFPIFFSVSRPRDEINEIIRKNLLHPRSDFEVRCNDFSKNIIEGKGGSIIYNIVPVLRNEYVEKLRFSMSLDELDNRTFIFVTSKSNDEFNVNMTMLSLSLIFDGIFQNEEVSHQSNRTATKEEIDSIREEIIIKKRRLNILKKNRAKFGYSTDPSTIMEIEDIEKEVANLERNIQKISE